MPADSSFRRQAVRAALAIHDHLAGNSARPLPFQLPDQSWEHARRALKRLRITSARNWHSATEWLAGDLKYCLGRLTDELASLREQLSSLPATQPVMKPREMVADIDALVEEFEDVQIDLKLQTLSVTTQPIELEGTYLGSFRIVLRWSAIGRRKAYDVIAIDPRPAQGDSDITHPHVRDGALCEGEGAAPIKSALAQGRLFDFFLLVKVILETYNADSAHMSLDRWDGVNCRDCGWRMRGDEHFLCERCDEAICEDCSSSCYSCDCYVCAGCSSQCAECGSLFCHNCLATPADTGRHVCEACLQPSNEEVNHDPEEEGPANNSAALSQEEESPTSSASTPLYPVCLGEAAVPA